jgi:hypothetical protein
MPRRTVRRIFLSALWACPRTIDVSLELAGSVARAIVRSSTNEISNLRQLGASDAR